MKFFSLHPDWNTSTLEDLAIHIIGGDWGKDPEFIEEGYESVYCIRGSEFKYWKKNLGNTAVLRKIKTSSLKSRELTKNDILIEISGGGPDQPVGRTVLIDERVLNNQKLPLICTNFLRLVRLTPCINASFINRFLEFFYSSGEVNKYQGGSNNLRNLKFKDYSKIEIPLPPLAEQKIIAEKLDTLLAQVDSTKARLEKIPQILKLFRQAVLSCAVKGKLTESWRENDEYNNTGYPASWKIKGLSELGEIARGKSKHRPRNDPKLFGDQHPFIQTGEVSNSLTYITNSSKYYSNFGLLQSRLFPAGTLCITIAANIADTAILGIDACFPDSVVGFISKKDLANVLFVKYLIDTNKDNLEAYAPATAQKNINLKVLNELKFPIPSLEEQAEIVRRVEQLFAYADTIEKQVATALEHVNNLTQSILAKAFRGELTAQWRAENPDLITGENSAAALLEKIKAERATSGTKKTARKKS